MKRKINNIIFDLGGVILNIDYQRTENAFRQLGITDFSEIYSQQHQVQLFDKFEKGEISSSVFRDEVRRISKLNLSDEQINNAWNSMLIGLPAERVEFLRKLKKSYRLFLLSNTNEIHIKGFETIIINAYGKNVLNSIFEQIYFSNVLGKRKPDPEVFEYVIDENNLIPKKTLFIDDTERHLKGASAAGLQTIHLKQGEEISDLLPKYLNI